MFTERMTLLLAARASDTRLSKSQIKDVQDKQMFVNGESPKVLCKQRCDICLFGLDLDHSAASIIHRRRFLLLGTV